MKESVVRGMGWFYRGIAGPFFYRWDSEPIHEFFLALGEQMGRIPGVPACIALFMHISHPSLATTVAGIHVDNPIGLAAGFDHEGQLPRIIGSIGFGFESIGTVTDGAYGGNPYPRIKRLVKSRSILVNKGFKSTGMTAVLDRLSCQNWRVPVGISIGRTNTVAHTGHDDAIADVVSAFRKATESHVPFSYYELNISCPNLLKDISFYEPERFTQLMTAIRRLSLDKPLFVKMPIDLSNENTLALVDTALHFQVAALIFGNLQHDRTHPSFDAAEMEAHKKYKGNWSGMPCQARSDELVALAYRRAAGNIAIIGCGGVFTAEDAYRKIRLGASLVQLVTATIFNGPQVAAEICADLPNLLRRDGFSRVEEAVGIDART
jgi:dihydroorotate dehydrogenase subfamily 2